MFLKKTMGQQWNQTRNEKTPQAIENENTVVQNLWDVTKTILKGRSSWCKPSLRNKKNFKCKLPSKTIREKKKRTKKDQIYQKKRKCKGLTSQIYKQLIKFNIIKQTS